MYMYLLVISSARKGCRPQSLRTAIAAPLERCAKHTPPSTPILHVMEDTYRRVHHRPRRRTLACPPAAPFAIACATAHSSVG